MLHMRYATLRCATLRSYAANALQYAGQSKAGNDTCFPLSSMCVMYAIYICRVAKCRRVQCACMDLKPVFCGELLITQRTYSASAEARLTEKKSSGVANGEENLLLALMDVRRREKSPDVA